MKITELEFLFIAIFLLILPAILWNIHYTLKPLLRIFRYFFYLKRTKTKSSFKSFIFALHQTLKRRISLACILVDVRELKYK
jgi:hypothetical protein